MTMALEKILPPEPWPRATYTVGAGAAEPAVRNPELCAFMVAVGVLLTGGRVQAHNGKLIRTGGIHFHRPPHQVPRPLRTKAYG